MMSRWWIQAKDWWFYFHQRGIFMHCKGMFWPCVVDNIAAGLLRRDLTWADWPARWHSKAADKVGQRYAETPKERAEWAAEAVAFNIRMDAQVARARKIRSLGWGSKK